MRRSWRAMAAIAATGVSVGLAGVIAGPAHAAPVRPASAAGTTYRTTGGVLAVAAAASNNAWAVGYSGQNYAPRILMLHWNGTAWSRVASPQLKLNGAAGQLSGITVVNSRDAYAVGFTGSPLGTTHTLLLHWNGSTWSVVTTPAPVSGGELSAVTATAKGGWAVGFYTTGVSALDYWTVTFRLTGSTWSRVSSRTNDATFTGVATTSAGITWATANEVGMITGALAKWSGSGWSWDRSFPVEGTYHALNGIAAGPRGIAFAVGGNGNLPQTPALSMEWTGRAWVKAPVSAPSGSWLNATTFAPGGVAWAAGSTGSGIGNTMIVRWNGREWARVASPGSSALLYGIGFSAAAYGWAVGYSVNSSGTDTTVILHWNGHTWS